jgi:hypothetical protein
VLEALGERLADAVHHRHRGLHPLLVRDLHDLEPAVGAGLLLRHVVAHALHEDLPATPGIESSPAFCSSRDHVARVHAIELRPEVHFAGTEAVHVMGWLRLM